AWAAQVVRDAGEGVRGERRRDRERRAVLAVAKAVAEDHDRPTAGGRRSRRQDELELQRVLPLRPRLAEQRAHGRDEALRGLVVRRLELAERDGTDHGRAQRRRRQERARE